MSKNSAKKWRSSIYQRKESDTLTNEYFDRTISKFLLQVIKPEIISLSILILLHKDCSLLCAYIFLIFFFFKEEEEPYCDPADPSTHAGPAPPGLQASLISLLEVFLGLQRLCPPSLALSEMPPLGFRAFLSHSSGLLWFFSVP